ncbi:hypothetical protein OSTOST_06010 [Ostertagia ostertagi]
MEVDTATDDSASQASNTSASSMAIQYSVDELQENGTALISDPNAEAVRNEGKMRRLNRRLALANLQLPKLTASLDSVIDLRTEEDKLGNMSWFKKKFPSVKTDVAKTENTAVHLPANVPPSIAKQKCLKQSLEKKLAERRRIGLAKRKELYMEDNEGLIEDEEEEEIDDGNDAQSSQKKKKEEEPEDSDDDYSADDEEEGKETDTESSQNSEMVDEDEEQKSLNLMLEEDGETESTAGMTQPQFPNSLSQWFVSVWTATSSSRCEFCFPLLLDLFSWLSTNYFCCHTRFPYKTRLSAASDDFKGAKYVNIGTFSDLDPFKDSCEDDILMLCSGRFETQNLTKSEATSGNDALDRHEDVNQIKAAPKKKRVLIESDEEEDDDMKLPLEGTSEEKLMITSKKEADSDDELAVIRRLEKNEFERNEFYYQSIVRSGFDDEASLSGDDIGSDLDEDGDIANEYEAEEGIMVVFLCVLFLKLGCFRRYNDDVPDSDVIRRQNHKLLLKQEKDREHKELVKLQDRLLADGDLGGSDTNRTFRLKLREDVTVVEGMEGDAEAPEEEQDEEVSQAHIRRVEAIKWLMEHESTHEGLDDKEEEDIFDVAARSVHISTEVCVSTVSKAPRSLLGQPSLANAIKEVAAYGVWLFFFSSTAMLRRALARSWQEAAQIPRCMTTSTRCYAAVGAKVVPAKIDKSVIEEDAEKLSKFVCINYFIQEYVNIGTFSDLDPFKDSCEDDILMLCSGRFETQNLTKSEATSGNDALDSHEDVNQIKAAPKKKRVLIESDEEEDDDVKLSLEGTSEEKFFCGTIPPFTTMAAAGANDYIEEEADSDDELAVIRRLEKNEFERKANREKWFDDEASLSGDDIGSDLDEDGDIANEYEAEEGDNDDVPDSDVIRRQNHKLLLKQEKDREHKELVKLQDRLLADGDLGGSDTNRTFRLKLREDVTVMEGVEGDAEAPEEEQDEEVSQAHIRRVEAIKWLMEHKSVFNTVSKAPRDLCLGNPASRMRSRKLQVFRVQNSFTLITHPWSGRDHLRLPW